MSPTWLVDHRGAPRERTRWRTMAVFAHTLSGSGKVVARSALGRLTPEAVDRVVARWCDHVFRISRTSLTVEAREHLPEGPALLVSNHRSLLDIPAVILAYPRRVRFVAKQELRRVPVFGRAMEEAGIVFVDRADRARAVAQLATARSLVAAGTSVWIAAEGGRSRDGRLGPFKRGPFHLAVQLGVPLVPTVIAGADRVIPATTLASVTGEVVSVRFGPPIPTAGLGPDDVSALSDRARRALVDLGADDTA